MKGSLDERIICAGFGGQGIMLMGRLLAQCGMNNGYCVTCLPSYGAEVRGGTAHSMVRITRSHIASPLVSCPTTCIVMNKPSLEKFIKRVEKKGLLIVNASMVDRVIERHEIDIAKFPLTELAAGLGNVRVANMIAIGIFINIKRIFPLESFITVLKEFFSNKDLFKTNEKALQLGYSLAKKRHL